MPSQTKSTANAGAAKPKAGASAAASKNPSPEPATYSASSRPDKAVYDAEQEKIKGKIDANQAKLNVVREKISLTTSNSPGSERRTALRSELDGIRDQQSTNKNSRGKILEQLKSLQESIQKKIKDLQAAKGKTPFKNVAEVDAHIKNLEKQVDSGNMKLADEKRALQEISQTKRSRRIVEHFQADQDAIEADRRAADELRQKLDDPEAKAVSDRYDAIKAELDELKKEADEAYASRNALFQERDALQSEIKTLITEKRESAQRFREANDRYYAKVNEDRARRAERARAQRATEEAQKKQEAAERLREEAAVPAFQAQIEDCQTLIDVLSGKSSNTIALSTNSLLAKSDVAGVPKLELRKVDAADEGLVARKKKGEDEESYFVGKGKAKKGKKGNTKTSAEPDATSSQLNLPLATLSALLSLSIPPPSSSADIPRVVEDLETKKAWFEANQVRVTAENVSKAEADIQRLLNGAKTESKVDPPAGNSELTPPNGGGEHLAEPAATPRDQDTADTAVLSDEMVVKLEEVKEEAAS